MFKRYQSCFSVLVVTFLSITIVSGVIGQGIYKPVFESLYSIINARWSNDSTLFVFQEQVLLYDDEKIIDTGVVTDNDTWHAYPAAATSNRQDSSAILNGNRWFLEPQSNLRSSNIQLATASYGQISFSFLSPDEEYIVYVAPKPALWESMGYPLAVTSLRSGETVFVPDISVPGLSNFEQAYNILWSADSSAFTIESTLDPVQYNFYVSNFRQNLDDISVTLLLGAQQQSIEQDGQTLDSPYPLNLSHDGAQILLRVSVREGLLLYLWDVANPLNRKLIAKTSERGFDALPAAAFTQSGDAILYVSPEGLMRYELKSGQTTLLDPDINSGWADRAWFSPDATKIALVNVQDSPGDKHLVYVLDVPNN